MATTTNISEKLRSIAADPMWANHAEISKSTLLQAASAIEVLSRLLNDYVDDDGDTRHDGFRPHEDDFPDHAESRKAQSVEILRTLTAQPRAVA